MAARSRPVERAALRMLTAADAALNRLYGWKGNPLYQSGTLVIALLLSLVATGVWLILFYRVGDPYASVERITSNMWIGNWVRGFHRYASDAAVAAIAVHAIRMYAQGRSWGPRALAWMSGMILLLLLMVCGWTGYVMVWDSFGQHLAREGARMLDSLPILSEPTSRAFTGERPVPSAFFFLNLFAHIGIPLAMGLVFLVHVSRVARAAMLPPRRLMWSVFGALIAVAVVWPLRMAPEASAFNLPERIPVDVFFAFWLPLSESVGAGWALAGATLTFLAAMLFPLVTRRRGTAKPAPSFVDESVCVGCRQCALDCPYEAITMIERVGGGRSDEVALVNPELCVSCGICSGSCAPMGVGPPGRTGRDQVARVRKFIASPERRPAETVVVCCEHGAVQFAPAMRAAGGAVYPIDCAGNVHTSVIELLLRSGAAGVLVLACPPRDCWNREGPRWLVERIYNDREAELQARVDRRRVRVAYANASEQTAALGALRAFMADTASLGDTTAESGGELDLECEPVPVEQDA